MTISLLYILFSCVLILNVFTDIQSQKNTCFIKSDSRFQDEMLTIAWDSGSSSAAASPSCFLCSSALHLALFLFCLLSFSFLHDRHDASVFQFSSWVVHHCIGLSPNEGMWTCIWLCRAANRKTHSLKRPVSGRKGRVAVFIKHLIRGAEV